MTKKNSLLNFILLLSTLMALGTSMLKGDTTAASIYSVCVILVFVLHVLEAIYSLLNDIYTEM